METSISTNNSNLLKFECFLGSLNRMLNGFVLIYVVWLSLQRFKYGDVPWHALLCVIGFNFFMAEGLMAFYKRNISIYTWLRQERNILHISLQALGSLFGIVGIIIRMNTDNVHFTTLHGKLGLAAFLLCLTSLLCGLSALFSATSNHCLKPVFAKTIHGFLGILTYTVATVCLIYGFDTYVFSMISPLQIYDSSVNIILVLKLSTLGSLIITIYGPLGTAIQKLWNYTR